MLTNHSPPVDQHDPDGAMEVLAAPLCPQLASVSATRMRVMLLLCRCPAGGSTSRTPPRAPPGRPTARPGPAAAPRSGSGRTGRSSTPEGPEPSGSHTWVQVVSRCCQGVKVSLVTVAAGWRRSGRPPRPCPPPRPRSRPRRGGRTPWRGSRPPRTPPST